MKLLKMLLVIPLLFLLTLLSVPFILIAMGYTGIGDKRTADKWYERAPLVLWLEFVEERAQ